MLKSQKLIKKKCKLWPNYEATACGRVFRSSTGKEMKQALNAQKQYLVFRACHNNRPENVFVHKAVASAWLDNPEGLPQVNHIDGDKLNNRLDNLEWCTPAQNQRHAIRTGLKGSGEDLYNASMTNNIAHLACQRLEDGWLVKDIADLLGVSKDIVRKIRAGDTYFHIRVLYNINHDYRFDFSESTVRWVCDQVLKGRSDAQIAKLSSNSNLKTIEVKRIRRKIRYKLISDEYF